MMAYLAGDYNLNGTVEQTDYNVWRSEQGNIGETAADGNGDLIVDSGDYILWRKNVGKTLADVPPDAPTLVEAAAVGPTNIQVTWQAASFASSYTVQRREPGTEADFSPLATGIVTTSYTDNTAASDTQYDYRLVAQNAHGSSPPSDQAQATANQSNLTVYRPQGVQLFNFPTGAAKYDPFPKKVVNEIDENSATLGPGIRINSDDDNQNGIADRAEMGTSIPQENDLIELKIDRLPGQGNLVLSAGFKLLMYKDYDKAHSFDSNTPITFVGNKATVFVEWVDSNHGTDSITLFDQATMTPIDTVRFHSFRSMVVIFGGNTQNPHDTDHDGSIGDPIKGEPGNREGIFDVAQNMYNTGWDVYAYDEEVDQDFPFNEVVNGVQRRFIDTTGETGGGISIMGYSQGGGATHDLIERLTNEQGIITTYGVYLDSVVHVGDAPQTDWPDVTFYMLNIYQTLPGILNFHGGDIDDNEVLPGGFLEEHNVTEEAGWDHSLYHKILDDNVMVKNLIHTRLLQLLDR
jgi:hypothetical protein